MTEKEKIYRKNNRERVNFVNKKSKYGYVLTYENYIKLIVKQNNKCAICKKTEYKKSLAIDHNHLTKEIRGLLCQKCNRGIGHFDDSIELLKLTIDYLRK